MGQKVCGFALKIEVECGSLEDAREAIAAGADIVMLDNFEPKALHEAAKTLKTESPHIIIEGSGGITETTIASYMGMCDLLSEICLHEMPYLS